MTDREPDSTDTEYSRRQAGGPTGRPLREPDREMDEVDGEDADDRMDRDDAHGQ
jgi:hypothetical protein